MNEIELLKRIAEDIQEIKWAAKLLLGTMWAWYIIWILKKF